MHARTTNYSFFFEVAQLITLDAAETDERINPIELFAGVASSTPEKIAI
jgi:hypothetical protein